MRLLNLASGDQAHPDWVNVELFPHRVRYRAPLLGRIARRLSRSATVAGGATLLFADLRDGIPFPAETFDAVYHSNFLEHLDRRHAEPFLRECLRVLRPSGVLRVVVPDLEIRVHAYDAALAAVRAGETGAVDRYRFAVVDLFDQMTRTEPGGELQSWLDIGWPDGPAPREPETPARRRRSLREWLGTLLAGEITPASAGELHRWMYDSYSLAELVSRAGFHELEYRSPLESSIPAWERYRLDVALDGRPRHAHCLYLEAHRP